MAGFTATSLPGWQYRKRTEAVLKINFLLVAFNVDKLHPNPSMQQKHSFVKKNPCYNFAVGYTHFGNVRPYFHGTFSPTAVVNSKKGKPFPAHVMKVHNGTGGTSPLIINPSNRDVWSASRHGTFTPGNISTGIH